MTGDSAGFGRRRSVNAAGRHCSLWAASRADGRRLPPSLPSATVCEHRRPSCPPCAHRPRRSRRALPAARKTPSRVRVSAPESACSEHTVRPDEKAVCVCLLSNLHPNQSQTQSRTHKNGSKRFPSGAHPVFVGPSSHLLLPQGRLRAEGRLFLPQTEKVQASVLLRLPTRPSPFPLPPVARFPLASSGVRLPQYVTLVSNQMALKRSPASSYVSPSLKVRASQTYAISLCSPPLASPLPSSLIPAQLLLRPLLLVPPIPPPP